MTSQQHLSSIRKISQEKGADPISAFAAASAARQLKRQINSGDTVIWPEAFGGIAWSALTNQKAETPGAGGTVYAVFGPEGPANPGLWKTITSRVRESGFHLELLVIGSADSAEPAGADTSDITRCEKPGYSGPDSSASDSDDCGAEEQKSSSVRDSVLVRMLKGLLARLEGREPSQATDGFEENIHPESADEVNAGAKVSNGYTDSAKLVLSSSDSLKAIARAYRSPSSPFTFESLVDSPEYFFLPGKTPVGERLSMARCIAAAGILPVVSLGTSEFLRVAHWLDSNTGNNFPVVYSVNEKSGSIVPFTSLSNINLLLPANSIDACGALEWVKANGGAAILVEPGSEPFPPRNAFRDSWETGRGVVVRESKKGNAGEVLLIVPGAYAKIASKAADKLVRENISVTLLSQRFLYPLDIRWLGEKTQTADLVVIAENISTAGDLKSRLTVGLHEDGLQNVILAPQGLDGSALADLTAREIREQRIRRTVDDVKADRWR